MLPLGGCLLATDKPDPALDIPQAYELRPEKSGVGGSSAAATRLVARFPFQGIDRAHRRSAHLQSRHRRGGRPHRAGRRAGARRRRAAAAGVALNGSATRSRPSQSTSGGSGGGGGGGSELNNLSSSLTASYEIDFWGKNRSALRAAEESAVASRYDREVVGLTTVVSVANAYFQVLAAQDRLRIARENVASATRILNLIKQQFSAGTASDLDVAQQESLVNSQRASVPPLEQTLRQSEATLALLIARPPERVRIHGGSMRSIAIPRVTPGLPSELLAQRPDIRAGGSATRRRQCQCPECARAVPAQHHAHRRGRLPERGAQDAAAAGVGVLHAPPPA